MKEVTFNDGIGSRGRRHINFLAVETPRGNLIVKFEGKDIPGVARVVVEDYVKNGKWSKNIWTLQVKDETRAAVFGQDWETGAWFPQKTWAKAIPYFLEHFDNVEPDDPRWVEAAERAIRTYFPKVAEGFDEFDANDPLDADPFELIEAQEKVAQAQRRVERAKKELKARIDAEELSKKAEVLEAARGKKMSLEELKELYNSV